MGSHAVPIHESMLRLAERCKTATRSEAITCLREAYELLHGPRMRGLGAPNRIFDTLVEALAFNEAAILLIPTGCTERVGWYGAGSISIGQVVYEVSIDRIKDGRAIGCCESLYRPLAYCGAAMFAHAHILEQKGVG